MVAKAMTPWMAYKVLAALGGAAVGSRYGTKRRTPVRSRARYIATRARPRSKRMSKRRWQAAARRSVALPRNYATGKTNVGFETETEVVLNQALKVASCIRIGKGVNINQRLRDSAIISGVRIQYAFRNLNSSSGFVNWAVVHPKDETTISDSQVDFFRDYTNSRAWNANATNKNGLEWSYAAINPDKIDILRRGKFMLGGNTGTQSSSPVKDDVKEIDLYVKLGRSFTWDTEELGQEPYENIYFVWWFAIPNDASGRNLGDGVQTNGKIITYFREPKSG